MTGGGGTGRAHRTASGVSWRSARPWLARGGAVVCLVAAYFLLPLDRLGPRHPVLSWLFFALGLATVAVLLLRQVRHVLTGRTETHPGVAISLLVLLSVHVFAAAYYLLAKQPGEFHGLHTRVDSLYFTVVTLATVGYGDITPRGQTARLVTLLQIVYSFVFLTAAGTALGQQLRSRVAGDTGGGAPDREGTSG
ncbi:potassium channel family protein [Streptomyces sp. SCL15-6]|uniref:potassium channel family protein n=1 Tax=Streptomyces sp. SCL15-6 TaxID=2967222 RepID=UPI00398FC392